jgi:hypothetical protein
VSADGRAAEVLRLLADCDSTGALMLDGTGGGIFYLVDGRVVAVETDLVPDLGTRTARPGFPAAVPETGPVAAARSVLVDATAALLAFPDGAAAPGFVTGLTSPSPGPVGVPVAELLAVAAAVLARLAVSPIGPDDVVALRHRVRRGVRLSADQWPVLGLLRLPQPPRAIAWTLGAELAATVLAVGDLVAQGACEVRERIGPRIGMRVGPPPALPAESPASGEPAELSVGPARRAALPASEGLLCSEGLPGSAGLPGSEGLPRRTPGASRTEPALALGVRRPEVVLADRLSDARRTDARRSRSTTGLPAEFASSDRALMIRLIEGLRRL